MKQWRLVFGACAALIGVLAACVGDDPSTPSTTVTPDAGVDAAGPVTSTTDAGEPPATDSGGPLTIVQIGMGENHGCALVSDGTVWCWGDNATGQLGISPPGATAQPPQKVKGIDNVASIAVGGSNTCAIKADASLWCWGINTQWQLGHDPDALGDPHCGTDRCVPTPAPVSGIFALSASLNAYQMCVVTTNHTVMCWGDNADGQCGAAASATLLPSVVGTLKGMQSVRVGYYGVSACGIDSVGQVWCWGKNTNGSLGHTPSTLGDLTYANGYYNAAPHKVLQGDGGVFAGVTDVVSGSTVCAVRSDGTVWCWGKNTGNHLTLAQADSDPHPVPTHVNGITNATRIGFGSAACALTDAGTVYCWGGSGTGVAPGTKYTAGCTTPPGTPEPCQDPALVPGPPLATLSVDHFSAGGLTLGTSIPFTWGASSTVARLGHPIVDGGDPQTVPSSVIGLP